MLDVPVPRIAIAGAEFPSGFVVGKQRRRAVVTVNEEIRRKLDPAELEAILAHKLAHVAHRDAAVMTVASLPRLGQVDPLSPFFMVGRRRRSFELFSDHPPVEKRIARLATIARNMGRPES
jgi:Zn-dependent protease with chaperone function